MRILYWTALAALAMTAGPALAERPSFTTGALTLDPAAVTALDVNHDGLLSAAELGAFLPVGEDALVRMIKAHDLNGDGLASPAELATLVKGDGAVSTFAKLRAAYPDAQVTVTETSESGEPFPVEDLDGDGKISRKEIWAAMQAR